MSACRQRVLLRRQRVLLIKWRTALSSGCQSLSIRGEGRFPSTLEEFILEIRISDVRGTCEPFWGSPTLTLSFVSYSAFDVERQCVCERVCVFVCQRGKGERERARARESERARERESERARDYQERYSTKVWFLGFFVYFFVAAKPDANLCGSMPLASSFEESVFIRI